MFQHMKKQGVKTIGFLGYTDAYGELWLKAAQAEAEKNGMKIVASERFARTDTSVTAQALKLVSANPDAMLIVATGSGAAMPEKAIVERTRKIVFRFRRQRATPRHLRSAPARREKHRRLRGATERASRPARWGCSP